MLLRFSLLLFCLSLSGYAQSSQGGAWEIQAPDGRNVIKIKATQAIEYEVWHGGVLALGPSPLSLTLDGGRILGKAPKLVDASPSSADLQSDAPFYAKRKRIRDHYNQLKISFEGGFALVFRAYNDGVAYRWETRLPGDVKVYGEQAALSFPADHLVYSAGPDCGEAQQSGGDCFHTPYERTYTVTRLSELPSDRTAFLPLLVDAGQLKILITESDLVDYPGMYLSRPASARTALEGRFPAYPLEEKIIGDPYPSPVVTRRADYLAATKGTRSFPWRVFVIAERDAELIQSDIVYRLGGEPPSGDWSWLKPGKSQSEWLSDNLLYGVAFQSGYNTETYKFYIDFNARFGLGYMFFDAGWSDVRNLLKTTEAMDMDSLIRYAHSKGLGVVLWTNAPTLQRQLVPAFEKFSQWGIKGVMVDFMNRDDQPMVNFYQRIAEEAAKRKMFVNFHGAYKPTGMERRFPNLATREAVVAAEYNKWSDILTPEYEVTVPFIRMVAGHLDYEPGLMRNDQKELFRIVGPTPHSQGTRMHQAAMFVVYESPYAKMGGNVSDYLREPEFTAFLARIPTVWEETRVLDARLADYVVLARRAGDAEYYIGAMTDWTARELEAKLDFLPAGAWEMEVYEDGPNAARYGADYRRSTQSVNPSSRIKIQMAPGGGWLARLTRKR